MPGFWLGGFEARRESLEADFEKRLGALRERLGEASSEGERIEIKEAIRDECEQHKRDTAKLNEALF